MTGSGQSASDASHAPYLALLDANVLLRALYRPTSSSAALLRLAEDRATLRVTASDVILWEVLRHAHDGLKGPGGRRLILSTERINQFMWKALIPLLPAGAVPRASVSRFPEPRDARWWNRPALEVVQELTGHTSEELQTQVEASLRAGGASEPLAPRQAKDLHVMVAAVEQGCDVLCTLNVRDFPERLGRVRALEPRALWQLVTGLLWREKRV